MGPVLAIQTIPWYRLLRMPPTRPELEPILAALHAQLDAMHAREPAVRASQEPEELRRMRVAVRRLRAFLRVSRPMFGAKAVDGLRRELDWLGTILGRARDVDMVMASVTAELDAVEGATRRAGRALLRRLEADRGRAWELVHAALDAPRYARLMPRLKTLLGRAPRRHAELSLVETAAGEWKKVRRAVKHLPGHPSTADLHQVRIRLKRARYAAELAGGGRRVDKFIQQAKTVQDILGEHQDAVVIEEYLHDVIDSREAAHALEHQLVGRQRKRRKKTRAAFLHEWPRLARRGRKAWASVA
jgi:CHAD domain-containing protein